MLSVSCIGLGNCGGQIANLAKREKDIPGIAINSSDKDLSNVSEIKKIIIGDTKGAGKNRADARKFMQEQISALLQEETFLDVITPHDVVFVISSIGGGTGSGMAPVFTDILTRKFSDKKFVLIEVYPPLRESLAAQQNGIDYLREVQKFIPDAVYMCYDNNRLSHLPTSEMMEKVNMEIVEHMDIIRGKYLYPTPYNSIDEKDMLRILGTPGRLAVYELPEIKEKDLDSETIEDKIINVIKNVSTNVELDRDKIIKRLGVISILNNRLNTMLDGDITKIKGLIGEPVEGYEHVYIAKDEDINKFILILSGLSIPDDRLVKAKQRIDEGLEELGRTKESSVLGDLNVTDIRDTNIDLDDLFGKYDE